MGTFCRCEPHHRNALAQGRIREDVLYRTIIPVGLLCVLDRLAIAEGKSMPQMVEEAIAEYCRGRGVDPELLIV